MVLVFRWRWRHEFHRRVETIRAAGYPTTLKELDAWYEWPQSGANAANWILGAAAMHQEPPREDWERLQQFVFSQDAGRPDPAQPLAADLTDLLERYIQANAKALESVHEAATIAECRYPIDLSGESGNFFMRHLSEVRKCLLLSCSEAILCAEKGDPNGAAAGIRAAVGMANSLDHEPVQVSRMVRMSGLVTAAAALERVLNRVELADRQSEMLCEAFHGLDLEIGLRRALAGQRSMTCPLFGKPRAIDRRAYDKLPPTAVLEVYGALGLAAREGALYLDCAAQYMRIAQLPVSQRHEALETVEMRRMRGRKGILLPYVSHTLDVLRTESTYVARLKVARVGLAVERYRRTHGELPETLEQLVPGELAAVPADPFGGGPLRYKRLDCGYLVYSLAEDGKDDGGKARPAKGATTSGETWDYAFSVRR